MTSQKAAPSQPDHVRSDCRGRRRSAAEVRDKFARVRNRDARVGDESVIAKVEAERSRSCTLRRRVGAAVALDATD